MVFVFACFDSLGRKICLLISGIGMSLMFFILGAMLKAHPTVAHPGLVTSPAPASRAMAGIIYLFVCFYSLGWGTSVRPKRVFLRFDLFARPFTMGLRIGNLYHPKQALRVGFR